MKCRYPNYEFWKWIGAFNVIWDWYLDSSIVVDTEAFIDESQRTRARFQSFIEQVHTFDEFEEDESFTFAYHADRFNMFCDHFSNNDLSVENCDHWISSRTKSPSRQSNPNINIFINYILGDNDLTSNPDIQSISFDSAETSEQTIQVS